MKKFILSMFFMVSFGFYVIWQGSSNSSSSLLTPTTVVSPSGNVNPVAVVSVVNNPKKNNTQLQPQPKPITPTTPIVPVPKKGLYKDGTYAGNVIDAYYGNMQVSAVISGGKLVDVQFLDYPRDAKNSVQINSRALPILRQEAIQAQSANINAVSGASASSPAFIQSLDSALNKAKA